MTRKVLVGIVLACLILGMMPIPVATEEDTYKSMSLHFPDSSELKIYPQIGTLRKAMVTEIRSNEYKYGFEDYNDYDWNDIVIRVKILEEDTDPVIFRVYLDEVNTMGVRELQIFLEAASEVAQVKLEYDDGTVNTYEMPSEGLTLSLYKSLHGEGKRPDCYVDVSVYETEETTPTPTEETGLRIEAHIKQIERGSLTSGDVEIPYEAVIIETDEIHGTADCKNTYGTCIPKRVKIVQFKEMSTVTYPTYITAPSQTGKPKFTKYQVDFSIDTPIERLFLQSSSIDEAEDCKVAVVKGLGGLLLPGPEASIGEQVTFSVTESQLEDIANEGHPTWEAFLKAIPFAEAADKCGFVTIDTYYVYITPPTTFEGEIKDKDITITKTEEGYKIGVCNNLWDSELDVFFDEVYQGTILKGPNWKYFTVDYKIDHVIVAAATGTSDEGRAWHRYLSEEDWPGTTVMSAPPDPNEYKPKIYLDKNEKWELTEVYYYVPDPLYGYDAYAGKECYCIEYWFKFNGDGDKRVDDWEPVYVFIDLNGNVLYCASTIHYMWDSKDTEADDFENNHVKVYFARNYHTPIIDYDDASGLRGLYFYVDGNPSAYFEESSYSAPSLLTYIKYPHDTENPFSQERGDLILEENIPRKVLENFPDISQGDIEPWCAWASAQMVLKYYGYGATQKTIAEKTYGCGGLEWKGGDLEEPLYGCYFKTIRDLSDNSLEIEEIRTRDKEELFHQIVEAIEDENPILVNSNGPWLVDIFDYIKHPMGGHMAVIVGYSRLVELDELLTAAELIYPLPAANIHLILPPAIRLHDPATAAVALGTYWLNYPTFFEKTTKGDDRYLSLWVVKECEKTKPEIDFNVLPKPDKNTYQPGETAQVTIDVTNNRDQDTEIWLGTTFKYPTLKDPKDIPLKRAIIPKGETESFDDIEWTIPADAPIGQYEIAVNCWKDAGQNEYYTDNILWAPIFNVDMITPVKARENVEDALGALASMAEAYYGFMELIYELSEVEPPEGSEVEFNYHVLSSRFCNNIAEAQTYMSSSGIESADMNDALELVRELELAKTGFCIVIVDYSFIGFGEYESGTYPIVCNEKGDPFWESWQFYEMIKEEIEVGYKEYEG